MGQELDMLGVCCMAGAKPSGNTSASCLGKSFLNILHRSWSSGAEISKLAPPRRDKMPRAARPQATSIGQKGAKERLQLTSAAFVFFSLSLSLYLPVNFS